MELTHIDNIIATISACTGILYTFLAGKGQLYCYLFGIMSSFLYGYLSFMNGLYGNCGLNILYYLPLQVLGIFQWKKHLKPKTTIIYKTRISDKERMVLSILCIFTCLVAAFVLKMFGDFSPFYDSFTTVLSLFGMYLTVRRAIEQWFIWMSVNGLSILMWCKAIHNGAHTYSTVIMWSVYFILAIYFYIEWKKELHMSDSRVD